MSTERDTIADPNAAAAIEALADAVDELRVAAMIELHPYEDEYIREKLRTVREQLHDTTKEEDHGKV